jgi:cytochrome P450
MATAVARPQQNGTGGVSAPGPRGCPFLGMVPALIKGGADYLRAVSVEYGDVAELKLAGPMRMYLLSHPDHVAHVLQTNAANYIVKRPSMHLEAMMGNGLTLSNGDLWRRQHRVMQPAFQAHKVDAMLAATAGEVARMLGRWRSLPAGPVDLAREMERLSFHILLGTLFGSGISLDESERIIQSVEFVLRVAGRGMFLEVPPFIPTPENLRVKRALRELARVIDGLIAQRRSQTETADDLLSLLLHARDDASGTSMSERQLRDEVTSVLVAGYETTAVAMTWMFYAISQNPEVERRMHEEIDAVMSDAPFDPALMPRLEYTQMVIQESLRLYPPFWAMTRQAVADDVVGGYRIPAKALVVVSPYVTQRHPKLWENPDRFDPLRFTPTAAAARHRLAYFPFGAGQRICIGLRNAMLAMQATLVMVAHEYRLTLAPGQEIAVHTAMTIRPKHGMLMNLEQRTARR